MPSGKQILLSLLNDCSQRLVEGDDAKDVTERLKAGLLLHGSSTDEMWFHVDRIAWISENEDEEIIRQGLGLKEKNIFLSDLFESIVSIGMPDKVIEKYPTLTKREYNSALRMIWCLLSSLQFFSQLSSIENDSNLDENTAEKLIDGYRKKLEKFRENPDEIIGKKGYRG